MTPVPALASRCSPKPHYDVVIMGGGPAGATLGSLLALRSHLTVAILDREHFPREHVGESMVHALIPILEETGALPKVLASDCWIRKYGGIFAWDAQRPAVTFFDQLNWLEDQVPRWAFHVDRAEFDHLLLQHTASQGVEVFEGFDVVEYEPAGGGEGGTVVLRDGTRVGCRLFVDASGRQHSIAAKSGRQLLSQYKNMAIWNHYHDCEPAQQVEADWNVFRAPDWSPVTCVAFEDGWVWYIPVRRMVDGQRVTLWSVGMVTDPTVVKEPGRDYTDPQVFLDKVRTLDVIGPLMQRARPLRDEMLIVANYSMVNERFCDVDERWMLVGDAAYFVDPLFSSGVTFAAAMSQVADLVIRTTLEGELPEAELRRIWHDYDAEWHQIAYSFALSIDQWYHAIANNHPTSRYWRIRQNSVTDLGIREQTFQALVDTAITPDLLQVMTSGTLDAADLDRAGPFLRTLAELDRAEPGDDDEVEIAPGVECRPSVTPDIPGFKASLAPPFIPAPLKAAIAQYWRELPEIRTPFPSSLQTLMPCHRIGRAGGLPDDEVRFIEAHDGGLALWAQLSAGRQRYGALRDTLSPPQRRLVKRLVLGGQVAVRRAGGSDGARLPSPEALQPAPAEATPVC